MDKEYVKAAVKFVTKLDVLGIKLILSSRIDPGQLVHGITSETYRVECREIEAFNIESTEYCSILDSLKLTSNTVILSGTFNGIPVKGNLDALYSLARAIKSFDEVVIEGLGVYSGQNSLGVPLRVNPVEIFFVQYPEAHFFAESKEDFTKLLDLLKKSFGSTNVSLVIPSGAVELLGTVADTIYQK